MVLQVIIHHAIGQVDKALQLLRETVTQAKSQGSIRLFVDEGAPMQTLLNQLPQEASTAQYVAQLLGAFFTQVTPENRGAVAAEAAPSHLPLSAFSHRELEILRLIQHGHSNQNIGERLFLSLSTVKWHNQNIFAKLDVQRRTEAVARALQLKLL
jgi:LuxR family maltose regulon positive regulatory protein